MTSNSSPPADSEIEWVDKSIPRSTRFEDTYYSKTDGLAETRHVFLAGNGLAERFAGLAPGEVFTLAETGFGTGLNFLAALALWRKTAPTGTSLHYVSFERFPLSLEDLKHALSRWEELATQAGELAALWRPDQPGIRACLDGQEELTVHFGDANTLLPAMPLAADAWFLDGFAPSRNPELWNAELMEQVYAHTRPGGSFATYTAAGWVRRNLQAAGFEVLRLPGHGGKREMLAGQRH